MSIDKIVENLKNANQTRSEFVELMEQFNNPYLVLIGCILSLRTNDKTTYPATMRMLKLGRTPKDFEKYLLTQLKNENFKFDNQEIKKLDELWQYVEKQYIMYIKQKHPSIQLPTLT